MPQTETTKNEMIEYLDKQIKLNQQVMDDLPHHNHPIVEPALRIQKSLRQLVEKFA